MWKFANRSPFGTSQRIAYGISSAPSPSPGGPRAAAARSSAPALGAAVTGGASAAVTGGASVAAGGGASPAAGGGASAADGGGASPAAAGGGAWPASASVSVTSYSSWPISRNRA